MGNTSKTPGSIRCVPDRSGRLSRNDGGNLPRSCAGLTDTAPACPGFCRSYLYGS